MNFNKPTLSQIQDSYDRWPSLFKYAMSASIASTRLSAICDAELGRVGLAGDVTKHRELIAEVKQIWSKMD